MSLKDTDVKTPGDKAIAKKFKLSLAKVRQLVKKGAKHEKEHNTNQKKAEEVARDHIGERPDYYKMLSKAEKTDKNHMKEEIGVGGVRGLGYVTGDPGVNPVDRYVNTNTMSYADENGNKLDYIKKQHYKYHNDKLGFKAFDPTKMDSNKNFGNISESQLNELGEYDNKGGMSGYEGTSSYPPGIMRGRMMKPVDEGKRLEKAKKVAMAGMTAANLYTAGDVASRASEGRGSPKGDVVRMASTLPGAAGWAATGVHYAKKAYDYVKRKKMNEDKDPCWKGYEMIGMKKKGSRKVPNCVPKEQVEASSSRYTERATYEEKDKFSSTQAERGIYQEGYASIGHPFDRFGDVNPRAKFYGKKPKPTTTKNDEKNDTYKDSKQGGKVKFAKSVKEDVGMSATTATAPSAQGLRPTSKLGRNAPAEMSSRGQSQGLNRAGNTFRSTSSVTPSGSRSMRSGTATPTSRMTAQSGSWRPSSVSGPQPTAAPKTPTSTARASFGSGGGSMKPTSTSGSTSFSRGAVNVGQRMAASKQTSPIVKGMTAAGRGVVAGASRTAASVVGRAAGALAGPAGAAVGAAAPVLGAKMKQSYEAGHSKGFAQHSTGGEKASSVFDRMRSMKSPETPKAAEAPRPKVDAPTPPSRPDYFTRGQAFSAARKEAGGGEGKFSYDNKSYQTNVSGEKYKPAAQLKQTSVKEETKMDNKETIQEAFDNILENKLDDMRDNFLAVLQEKAMEKLEERKKDIASNYFAQ